MSHLLESFSKRVAKLEIRKIFKIDASLLYLNKYMTVFNISLIIYKYVTKININHNVETNS